MKAQNSIRSDLIGKVCWSARIIGFEITGFTIEHGSIPSLNSFDDFFTEQALRSEQQEGKRQHIGEPVFNRTAEKRSDIGFGEFFTDADDQPADNGAGNGGKAAQDQNRQAPSVRSVTARTGRPISIPT